MNISSFSVSPIAFQRKARVLCFALLCLSTSSFSMSPEKPVDPTKLMIADKSDHENMSAMTSSAASKVSIMVTVEQDISAIESQTDTMKIERMLLGKACVEAKNLAKQAVDDLKIPPMEKIISFEQVSPVVVNPAPLTPSLQGKTGKFASATFKIICGG